MCEHCGCSITGTEASAAPGRTLKAADSVAVLIDLLAQNDRAASHNRQHLDHHGVLALNLMSSPGAGKTSLLERTIEAFKGQLSMAVIEGDLATENDAQRIRARGVPAVQITTGTACHLDAAMVHRALHGIELDGLDLLFIENVGNLVCPACFDLGQHLNVILLSVPEGDDKPQKYPVMFRAADLTLLTKCDLLPLLPEFDAWRAERAVRALGVANPVLRISSRSRDAVAPWCQWVLSQLEARRRLRAAAGAAVHHE